MKVTLAALLALGLLGAAEQLHAHGFPLSINVDGSGNPVSITAASNQPVLDQDGVTAGPENLFLDNFFIQTSGSNSGEMGTVEGGPQVVGPAPPWANATMTIVSPLYFSDGSAAAAVPASTGTYLQFYDLYAGNSDGNHPGAGFGSFNLTGSAATGSLAISLYDFHEVEKDLHLPANSTQTYGEYGFAFDVTVPFDNGTTLTVGPLVDVFGTGTGTDPDDPSGFSLAPDAQQDVATEQVYDAAMAAAPEPSTLALASAASILFGLAWLRRRRKGRDEMRTRLLVLSAVLLASFPNLVCAHGFSISVNSSLTPSSLSVASQEPGRYFDNFEVANAPQNMFIEDFSFSPTPGPLGDYYLVLHGFAATSGPMPAYTATFNVVSPLYFSNGLPGSTFSPTPVVAQPASAGTFMNIYDLWAGNPDPVTDPHPGASSGTISLTGTTSFAAGFGVSLYDQHELEHDLYLATNSTQTYGEYGFAYTVTMYFPGTNTTLTTVPLVDVYAVSDPDLGDFPDNAGTKQQDAASVAIFQAATRAAAPSWTAAASGSWTNLANWSNWPGNGTVGSPPTGAGVQVALGAATTASQTITLDNPQTIGSLIFDNSASNAAGYTVSAGSAGTLTLNNLTAGAEIYVTSGSNAISANTILADNLFVTPNAGTTLVISGNLSQSSAGKSLTLSGPGTLVLSGSNLYSGGTYVTEGTLEALNSAALPSGSALTVGANAAFVSDEPASQGSPAVTSSTSGLLPVPEPGAFSLLFLGGIFIMLHCARRACRGAAP